MKTTYATIVLLLLSLNASAQSQIPVFIDQTAPDTVGSRLAYAIKEGIRRSASMKIADRQQDGIVWINFVTLDPNKNGAQTIYSAVWTVQTFHPTPITMYRNNFVGVCGTDRVSRCADSIVAETDNQASFVRAAIKEILEDK